jgi:Zn-dependent M28 family amino/carboxypeptidase
MSRKLLVLVSAVLLVAPSASYSQATVASRSKERVELLASDRLEGREAGSPGERLAADYIAAELARSGAKPLPQHADLFLAFDFTAGSRDGGSRLTITAAGVPERTFTDRTQVQALSFSDDAEISGPVVFAGYGLVVPDSQSVSYDSYAGLEVKDKIVVVLRYFPEDADQNMRAVLARYSELRYKAQAARQRGAKALIVVTGPKSPNAGTVVPMTFDTALAGSGIPAASISGDTAAALFTSAKSLRDVQQELDSGNPHVAGFDIPGVTITLKTAIVREHQTARNVVAYLPATTTPATDKPWIIVGAHYDHLGRGGHGNSLADARDVMEIHHGADDNASGVAAVLEIADTLSKQPRRRNVMFALWSAEEIGLVGSTQFVNMPPVPLGQVAAYLNFDMVGRMKDNKLIVQATGTSPAWGRMLERANIAAGFDLNVQPDPYQPTDVASFNQAGVASLAFFTGSHTDYHKPSDTADKIDYEDLDRIAVMAASIVKTIGDTAEAPRFTKVDQPVSRGSLAGVLVTTGTIPDYTTEAKGLLLSGVIGGGPAEQAGLMKGDIIIEIAGQSIANIYDYTYALELLRVNQPVKVVYMRNGERREVQLTPAARK